MRESTTQTEVGRPWPYQALAIAFLVSAILASATLPALDGGPANRFRLGICIGVLVIFWSRVLIARCRHETNRDFWFYVVFVLAAPFAIWPLQGFLLQTF